MAVSDWRQSAFFYTMAGLESDDPDIWAYHYPPADGPGLDGSYHVTDTIFPYTQGTFAPIGILINQQQATMPWSCYNNDIYSAYEGSTWVVAHTLGYRCLVAGFSCEFRPGDVPGVGSPCVPPLFPVLSEILAGGQQQLQELLSIRLVWGGKTTLGGAVDTVNGVPCYLS